MCSYIKSLPLKNRAKNRAIKVKKSAKNGGPFQDRRLLFLRDHIELCFRGLPLLQCLNVFIKVSYDVITVQAVYHGCISHGLAL